MSRLIIFILSVMLLLGTGARANELLKALEKNKSKTNVDNNKKNLKDTILNCKILRMSEYNNNKTKTYLPRDPREHDIYFHYNLSQKFILGNFEKLKDYREIFAGINYETSLYIDTNEKNISFSVAFGPPDPSQFYSVDTTRLHYNFIIDKYNLRMNIHTFIIKEREEKGKIYEYQCQETTKAIP
jgi:hypothetical protein